MSPESAKWRHAFGKRARASSSSVKPSDTRRKVSERGSRPMASVQEAGKIFSERGCAMGGVLGTWGAAILFSTG